jgi:hypothetical protein
MMKHRLTRVIALLASVVLVAACEDPVSSGPRVAAATFGQPTLNVVPGQTLQPPLDLRDEQGQPVSGRNVRWSSSDPSFVTVSSTGAITGVRAGRATVTAYVDGVYADLLVLVYTDNLHVWPDTLALLPGDTRRVAPRALVPSTKPENLAGARWESSNPAVARVDSTGLVTAVAGGHATIIATVGMERLEGHVYVITYPAPLRFTSLSVGENATCGLTADGEAYCWGIARYGELGAEPPTDRCESLTSDLHGFYFRDVFRCSTVPLPVARGLRFAALTTGPGHLCGLTSAGAVYCWGNNTEGTLGGGTTGGRSATPVRVAGGIVFRSISAGRGATCGVSTTNEGYCWGNNFAGFLGNGSTTNSNVPTPVAGGLSFARIDLGYGHACGITTGGAPYCWGRNVSGELGVEGRPEVCPVNVDCSTRPVPVSGGLRFREISAATFVTCGLTLDDRAYCWGDGTHGKLGNGQEQHSRAPAAVAGSIPFTTLTSGFGQSCGLDRDGKAYCWGSDVLLLDGTRPLKTLQPTRSAPEAPLRAFAPEAPVCGVGLDGIAICWQRPGLARVPGQ